MMCSTYSGLALLILLLSPEATNGSFVIPSLSFHSRSSSLRQVTWRRRLLLIHKAAGSCDPYLGGNSDEDNMAFDVEAARQKLEALLVGASDDTTLGAPSQQQQQQQQQQGSTSQNREQPPPTRTTQQQRPSGGRSFFDMFFGPSQTPKVDNPQQQQRNSENAKNYQLSSSNMIFPSSYFPLEKNALSVLDKPLRNSLTHKLTQHPLTAMELERRRTEISLLSQLVHSDEALDDLWNIWFHERGHAGAQKIKQVEQLMANSATWPQADKLIRQLIQEHGTSWAEPLNRLATLYYMQGRLMESEVMCQLVLNIKPWHFGALSGIVMVYASLGKTDMAKYWAARRLPSLPPPPASQAQQQQQQQQQQEQQAFQEPNKKAAPLPTNRRRQMWVRTATEQATRAIQQLELERDQWWGPADKYQFVKSQSMEQVFQASEDDSSTIQRSCDEGKNAWQ